MSGHSTEPSQSVQVTKRRNAPKGTHDTVIRQHIADGLHLNSLGKICLPDGKELTGTNTKKGYRVVTIGMKGKRVQITVARIVCWLSHGEPPTPQHEVDHKDRNRGNDSPDNLRWATQKEQKANVSKEYKEFLRKDARAKGHAQRKLTMEDAREVRRLYPSVMQKDLAVKYGVKPTTVWNIISGKTYREDQQP